LANIGGIVEIVWYKYHTIFFRNENETGGKAYDQGRNEKTDERDQEGYC
jgi:hypothetical protein